MHFKNQPRGSYQKINEMAKQKALEMKEQGFKIKKITKETGIKPKTIYSLSKVKKSKFGSITDRIKTIYLEKENNREQIPPLKIIKKKIKKIIETHNDPQLSELIKKSSKKFDSSNRRVIQRIAEEIEKKQYGAQQNVRYYPNIEEEIRLRNEKAYSNEVSTHPNEESTHQNQEYSQYIGQVEDWIFLNFESNRPFFLESESQMEENQSFCFPDDNQNQQQKKQQEEQVQNQISNFQSNSLFPIQSQIQMEGNSYKSESLTEGNSSVCNPILDHWGSDIQDSFPNKKSLRNTQNKFD